MKHSNRIVFELRGEYAMFTDPLTKGGGEKFTLPVPTYEALKGAVSSIYWSPAMIWVIDSVRVMNQIRTESVSVKRRKYRSEGSELSVYTYLRDVRYRVRAHFIWNENRPDHVSDRSEDKYYSIAKRMLERGGRRPVYLGTKDCPAEVAPCSFAADSSYYDTAGIVDFGLMYHGMTYPDEACESTPGIYSRLWQCKMENGVIRFPKPQECSITRFVRKKQQKNWEKGYELV